MKKNKRFKFEAILVLENQGITVTEKICAEQGVTLTEFNNWKKTLIEYTYLEEVNPDETWRDLKLSYIFMMSGVGCF